MRLLARIVCLTVFATTLFWPGASYAQKADTLSLEAVKIQELADQAHYAGVSVDTFLNISAKGAQLDQSLPSVVPIYIKNYGTGNISTASYRGGNASQVIINWNGLDVPNLNSGNLDFSLMPLPSIGKVAFGNASQGNSFGTLYLSSDAKLGPRIRLGASSRIGLHGLVSNQMAGEKSTEKCRVLVQFQERSGENRFPIWVADKNARQDHASLRQKMGMLSTAYQLLPSVTLFFDAWVQNSEREVPPALGLKSFARQKDVAGRYLFKVLFSRRKFYFQYHQAILLDGFAYIDTSKSINSKLKASNWIHQAKWDQYVYKSLKLYGDIVLGRQEGVSANYGSGRVLRHISSLRQGMGLRSAKTSLQAHMKVEFVDAKLNPLQYQVQWLREMAHGNSLELNLGRYLRNPSFNDLFWVDLGNPHLKPEYGPTGDLTYSKKIMYRALKAETNVAIYAKDIKDWILWQPNSLNVWSASNAREVFARGLEVTQRGVIRYSKWNIKVYGYYSFSKSTYKKDGKAVATETEGKQLIYVPLHQASVNLSVGGTRMEVGVQHRFVGWRFTSSDNTEFLPSCQITSTFLTYQVVHAGGSDINATLRIENLFDHNIEWVKNQPSALRTITIGFDYKFN